MTRLPHASPRSRRLRLSLLSGLVLLRALLAVSQGQITLDGSLGPRGPLSGPNYRIDANMGQIRGSNLFHSFGQFTVRTDESATFGGPDTITNVVGRVTGGEPSLIDGRLRSEIAGANLFLLNPSGVMFGPKASLEVSGSFHVSTADFLRFADGAKFFANLARESVLTVAPPAAFGFLNSNPAPITIRGSSLQVPTERALSIMGGDITMAGGRTSSGRLLLASVASPGEAVLNPPESALGSFAHLGQVELSQGALVSTNSLRGGSAGDVTVRGRRVTLTDGAQIVSNNTGGGRGSDVTIVATEMIFITGSNSGLFSAAQGQGPGGDLQIQARTIELRNGATIAAFSASDGAAGNILLQAGDIFRSHHSQVTTETFRSGGGTIALHAGRLALFIDTELSTSVSGDGRNAGDLTLNAPFVVLNGSDILANAFGGRGGNVLLRAEVFLADPTSGVSASSSLGITGFLPPLSGSLVPLPQTFVNVAALLPARCAARFSGGKASSLALGGRDGLPLDPSGVLPSPLVPEERLAAEPAVIRAPPSPAKFALLTGADKGFPRLRVGKLDWGCAQ
jgi:filamentous hemagglutinin family protein